MPVDLHHTILAGAQFSLRTRNTVVLFALALAACGPKVGPRLFPDPLAQAPGVAGCWRVRALGWNGTPQIVPGMVLLLDTAVASEDHPEWRLVRRVDTDTADRALRFSGWGIEEASGNVYVGLGDGFGGYEISLKRGTDEMTGRAKVFTDFWSPFSGGGRVEAKRVNCPNIEAQAAHGT